MIIQCFEAKKKKKETKIQLQQNKQTQDLQEKMLQAVYRLV